MTSLSSLQHSGLCFCGLLCLFWVGSSPALFLNLFPQKQTFFLTQGLLCYSQSDCTSVSHRKMHFSTETIQEKGQVRFIQQTVHSEAYIPRNTFKCTLSNQLVFGRAWKVLLDRRCISYAAVGSRHAVCQDRQANMV